MRTKEFPEIVGCEIDGFSALGKGDWFPEMDLEIGDDVVDGRRRCKGGFGTYWLSRGGAQNVNEQL